MDLRTLGMKEQYVRARHFVAIAKRCKNDISRFRNLIAAVYPACAIAELMFECADKDVAPESRDQINARLEKNIPYFLLVEKIRIHDFHRFGCLLPSRNYQVLTVGGAIKLKASKGHVHVQVTRQGLKIVTSGNSKAESQRPLLAHDGKFFDEVTGQYVALEEALRGYLDAISKEIHSILQNMAR